MARDPVVRLGRRRVLQGGLAAAGLALLSGCGMPAPPWAAPAQVFRLGLFHVGLDHVPPSLDGLREGLKALGYDVGSVPTPLVSTVMEGTNIRLDWRNLPDEATALETAKTFVQDRVDLIVAFESQCVRAAKAATSEIPVVFLHVTDPVAEGFAKSLAYPGGNMTGFGEFFVDVLAKRMEVFKELVPQLGSLLVLIDPQDRAMPQQLAEVRKAANTLKLLLVEREVTRQSDVETVIRALQPEEVQGIFVASSSLVTKFPSLLLRLAAEQRLPVPGHRREWAEDGALFSYGANFRAVGRDAATYVDKILKGARPADLPVEQVTRLELVVNLRAADALDLTIPSSGLQQSTEVIQ
jgi:putative tryptophan/tyrosine transport system substrate-binding protein